MYIRRYSLYIIYSICLISYCMPHIVCSISTFLAELFSVNQTELAHKWLEYAKWHEFDQFYFNLKKWTFHNWIIIQNYDHALFYQRDSAWITWFSIIYLKQNQLNWILRWWKSLRSGASHHSSKYSFCSCVAKRFNCR